MVGGQGWQAAVAFVSNVILVRYLFPEDFGRFALIQATIGLAASTFSLRINTILIQASEEELKFGRKNQYLSALIGQTLLVFPSSVALLWFFDLWSIWAMVLLTNVLIEPWIFAQGVLYERHFRYKNLSLVESGSHFASHLFAVIGVFFGLGFAVLYLRGWIQMLVRLGGLAYVGGLERFRVRWLNLDEWVFVFRKIQGFWLQGWLEQSFERLVILCLGLFEGHQTTGYFFQARRLAVTPHQLLEPIFSRVFFNFLSHKVTALEGIQVLKQVLKVQVPVLILIAGIAIFMADPVISWVFGPGWDPVVPLFQALGGVLIGMTSFYTLGAFFRAQNLMGPFIAFGQGFQYCALVVAILLITVLNLPAASGIAVGLSVGYLGGCFVVLIPLRELERKSYQKPMAHKE